MTGESNGRVLCVIPARSGSKGLPDKNIRVLAGIPLIAHSIACALLSRRVDRVIVSTDSEAIAEVARTHGGDVPFIRPAPLAADETPMLPVLQHALETMETQESRSYDMLLLLEPTAPARLPEEIDRAVAMAEANAAADGVVAVSRPDFSIPWQSVRADPDGFLVAAVPEAARAARRQDVDPWYWINGALYLFKTPFLRGTADWRAGHHLMLEVPRRRAIDIDDLADFETAEHLLATGFLELPWLERIRGADAGVRA